MTSRRMRGFKRWMAAKGITYSDALDLADSPGAHGEGISVFALRDLAEGETVATIPKRACLTIKTTAARRMIAEAALAGHLGLSVAVMFERSIAAASPWHGYLQILPAMESSPLVWSCHEIDSLLAGTELHKIVKEDQRLVHEDWKEYIEPLIEDPEWGLDRRFFGVDQYFAAKTLVASRSFAIDHFHGYGMVPLADLFNHKTGLENVHFTDPYSSSSDDDDDDDDDDDRDHEHDHDDEDDDHEDDGIMEMIIVRSVKAGDEVFNTYGSTGNAALLLRYGFTELDNPFDIVNMDLNLVLQCCPSSISDRRVRSRLRLWRQLGLGGCESQESEYFEISPAGEPQIELLLLLYIINLPDDAIEKSKNIGDGSGMDPAILMTYEVCEWMMRMADARERMYGGGSMEEEVEKLSNCRRSEERKVYDSLVLRVMERKVLNRFRAFIAERRRGGRGKRGRGMHSGNPFFG
ncbi:SET domain-containing protein isoform X2 [Wolffia australiana]